MKTSSGNPPGQLRCRSGQITGRAHEPSGRLRAEESAQGVLYSAFTHETGRPTTAAIRRECSGQSLMILTNNETPDRRGLGDRGEGATESTYPASGNQVGREHAGGVPEQVESMIFGKEGSFNPRCIFVPPLERQTKDIFNN